MALKRLSHMTDEGRQKMLDFVAEKYGKPLDNFNTYGLRFSIEYLNKVAGSIITLPLECMAEYADIIVTEKVKQKDEQFMLLSIHEVNVGTMDLHSFNATSLGNLAYVCLYCHDEEARKKAELMLEKYEAYYRSTYNVKSK